MNTILRNSLLLSILVLGGLFVSMPRETRQLSLQHSGSPAPVPAAGQPFADYVEQATAAVNTALSPLFAEQGNQMFAGGYRLSEAVAMRAPYEILPSTQSCGEDGQGRLGILLTHGLTDSPYLLKPLARSLAAAFPCALVRGILLPGHGTVPGDTLYVDFEQWQQTLAYAIDSFRTEVDSLYLVGYSMGSTLALDYLQKHPDDTLPAGQIMLSPALEASSRMAFLSPWLSFVRDWLSTEADRDAGKYESFSVNAGAEFYLLSNQLNTDQSGHIDLPVLMVVTGDDQTINPEAARTFFCERTNADNREMIWYFSETPGSQPASQCQGMKLVAARHDQTRVLSYAHTAITMPADDPHYGLDAVYRNCLHYAADSQQRQRCLQSDSDTVYGEHNLLSGGLTDGKLLRRGTFNPRYDEMLETITCFISKDC